MRTACQLDGKTATNCVSPKTYTGLAYGSHKVLVRATNRSGSLSASTTWRVDRPAPTVTLASPPTGSTTSTSATLSGTSTDATSIVCQLDNKTPTTCAGLVTYSGLAVGTHTFTVTVSNTSGSASAQASWTVIAAPVAKPTVTLASPPTGSTTSTSATLPWTSTDATSIVCQLDNKTPTTCAGPVTYSGLAVGTHTFTVTVSNASGSASAQASWTVVSTAEPPKTPDPSAVQPAAPPTSYSLPAGSVVVTSSSGLISALSSSTSHDIVLADGTYDNASPFNNANGHHLYAQHLGGAILTAGLEMGGNGSASGGLVQGITFNVSSSAKTSNDGIVTTWGNAGASTQVLDCVFRGNKVIGTGVLAYNPAGLVAQRLQFYDFTDVALWASDNTTVSYGASTPIINSISDIYVNGVSRAVPGASGGTGEAGLWIGHPVINGVHRIKVRNVSWSGIETVNNSWDTTFSDLDIDMSGPNEGPGVGVYLEHFNYHNTFQNFLIRGANAGFNAEWADPDWGGVAASHSTAIEDGTIDAAGANDSRTIGVYLDEGTDSTTVTRVIFLNQRTAAIVTYKSVGTNNFVVNDYSGLATGAVKISTGHP